MGPDPLFPGFKGRAVLRAETSSNFPTESHTSHPHCPGAHPCVKWPWKSPPQPAGKGPWQGSLGAAFGARLHCTARAVSPLSRGCEPWGGGSLQ